MFKDSQGFKEEGHIRGFIKLAGASMYISLGLLLMPLVAPLRRIQYGIWEHIEPIFSSRGWVMTFQESAMSVVYSAGIISEAVKERIKSPLRPLQRRALIALVESMKDEDDTLVDNYPVKT